MFLWSSRARLWGRARRGGKEDFSPYHIRRRSRVSCWRHHMKTKFANQKRFTITRNTPKKGDKKPFITLYLDSIEEASRTLQGEVAFKLYLYLASNQDGFSFDFSPQDFANRYGASVDRARKVIFELEKEGYLFNEGGNNYRFYENPIEPVKIVVPAKESRIAQGNDGKTYIVNYTQFYESQKDQYPLSEIERVWNSLPIFESSFSMPESAQSNTQFSNEEPTTHDIFMSCACLGEKNIIDDVPFEIRLLIEDAYNLSKDKAFSIECAPTEENEKKKNEICEKWYANTSEKDKELLKGGYLYMKQYPNKDYSLKKFFERYKKEIEEKGRNRLP